MCPVLWIVRSQPWPYLALKCRLDLLENRAFCVDASSRATCKLPSRKNEAADVVEMGMGYEEAPIVMGGERSGVGQSRLGWCDREESGRNQTVVRRHRNALYPGINLKSRRPSSVLSLLRGCRPRIRVLLARGRVMKIIEQRGVQPHQPVQRAHARALP